MNPQDIVMETVLSILGEKIDPEILKAADTKELRKSLWQSLTKEMFYILLKEKKLCLSPGFGTLLIKSIKEKDKKVFDKKSNEMVTKKVKGSKVVYRPGDSIRSLL
jgi:hypothetical protein